MTRTFHQRAMRIVVLLLAVATGFAVAAGCTSATDLGAKGALPDVASGKADGSLQTVDVGALALDADNGPAVISEGQMLEWTLTLEAPAELLLETKAGVAPLDTVLFVFGEDGELDSDDDGGEGLLSALTIGLDAGVYRIGVTLYPGTSGGEFALHAACAGEACGGASSAESPWELAKDVNLHRVPFPSDVEPPETFERASVRPVSLAGPEWWQRWPGGVTQNFSWSSGSFHGQRCAQASAIRLQAIWDYEETDESGEITYPGRDAFNALIDGSGWRGGMFNWIEDISEGGRAIFSPATMWAWRTGTVKWVVVARADGVCELPTLELVQGFSETCRARAERDGGEIQGCRVSAR